jgi:hypothetical protein
MDAAKIQFSQKEMQLVTNADWILTKNLIIQKVKWMLECLQERQKELAKEYSTKFSEEIFITTPKISKGENYLGLPFLILDYPRLFIRDNIFAVRSMFWWGKFFSTTLHLSGTYKNFYSNKIIDAFTLLKENDFFICIHNEEWQHHFEKDNYAPLQEISLNDFKTIIQKNAFIKLAQKTELSQLDRAEKNLFNNFRLLMGMLKD